MNARIGTLSETIDSLALRYPTLRRHQLEALDLAQRQASGDAPVRTLVEATPGAGKSALPSIVLHTLRTAHPDLKMMWIVPRKSLQSQGVDSTSDKGPYAMRTVLDTDLHVCEGANTDGVGSGCDGYVITYQSVNRAVGYHLDALDKAPYAIFLDECHHIKESSRVGSEDAGADIISKLLNHPNCKYAYFMTGTAERHDQNRLAFIPYRYESIDFDHPEWNFIRYSRADAIAENAKLPLNFIVLDAKGVCDVDDHKHPFGTLKGAHPSLPPEKRLRTALESDFAYEMLDQGVKSLQAQRHGNPGAQMIVLARRQKEARAYREYLSENSPFHTLIAISSDTSAQGNIVRFRQRRADILVTVGMAHEGLDAPGVGVVVALTHIRSKPWLEQAFDRATRIDHQAPKHYNQDAVVFVPADDAMTEIRNMIVQEQRVLPAMPQETSDGGAPFSNGRNDDNFMAIESHVINGVIEREDFAEPMSLEEFEWLKQNEEDVRTFAEAVIIKKTLMKHGLYRYESADRVTVSVEKAKRMARGTGDILFSALFDDARYAAIRNGAGHSDFEAPWQMIARAIETHPRIAKADRMTPDDISQLRRTLNGKGA